MYHFWRHPENSTPVRVLHKVRRKENFEDKFQMVDSIQIVRLRSAGRHRINPHPSLFWRKSYRAENHC